MLTSSCCLQCCGRLASHQLLIDMCWLAVERTLMLYPCRQMDDDLRINVPLDVNLVEHLDEHRIWMAANEIRRE